MKTHVNTQIIHIKNQCKVTVHVISSGLPCKDGNVHFTMISTNSDEVCGRYL